MWFGHLLFASVLSFTISRGSPATPGRSDLLKIAPSQMTTYADVMTARTDGQKDSSLYGSTSLDSLGFQLHFHEILFTNASWYFYELFFSGSCAVRYEWRADETVYFRDVISHSTARVRDASSHLLSSTAFVVPATSSCSSQRRIDTGRFWTVRIRFLSPAARVIRFNDSNCNLCFVCPSSVQTTSKHLRLSYLLDCVRLCLKSAVRLSTFTDSVNCWWWCWFFIFLFPPFCLGLWGAHLSPLSVSFVILL